MIKDIQTASFFLKDGLNDNSSFRWCFCPGDEGGPSGDESAGSGGYGGVPDADVESGVQDSLSVDEAKGLVGAQTDAMSQLDRSTNSSSRRSNVCKISRRKSCWFARLNGHGYIWI